MPLLSDESNSSRPTDSPKSLSAAASRPSTGRLNRFSKTHRLFTPDALLGASVPLVDYTPAVISIISPSTLLAFSLVNFLSSYVGLWPSAGLINLDVATPVAEPASLVNATIAIPTFVGIAASAKPASQKDIRHVF